MSENSYMFNIQSILSERTPKLGKTLFIAIDGHSGSGKSSCAEWLSKKLGAQVIHTDDFASWNNPFNWADLVIERVFLPIQHGSAALNYPRSKWWDNHFPEPVRNQTVTNIMILEGVGSMRSEFKDFITLGIFVNTPKELCLQRGLDRDANTGKTREELLSTWNDWFEAEEIYMKRDDPKTRADVVIDGTKPFEDQMHIQSTAS